MNTEEYLNNCEKCGQWSIHTKDTGKAILCTDCYQEEIESEIDIEGLREVRDDR